MPDCLHGASASSPLWIREFRRLQGNCVVGRGDHWIFGGALAIATLACADTTAALTATSTLTGLEPALEDATLALWAAAALWRPVLLVGEVIAPRLGYDTRRWSTVFPFGMYAVCSLATGGLTGIGGSQHLRTRVDLGRLRRVGPRLQRHVPPRRRYRQERGLSRSSMMPR